MEDFLREQDDAERLSQYCKNVTYDRGKVIYNVGQHADEFYIVLSGQVSGARVARGGARWREVRGGKMRARDVRALPTAHRDLTVLPTLVPTRTPDLL